MIKRLTIEKQHWTKCVQVSNKVTLSSTKANSTTSLNKKKRRTQLHLRWTVSNRIYLFSKNWIVIDHLSFCFNTHRSSLNLSKSVFHHRMTYIWRELGIRLNELVLYFRCRVGLYRIISKKILTKQLTYLNQRVSHPFLVKKTTLPKVNVE